MNVVPALGIEQIIPACPSSFEFMTTRISGSIWNSLTISCNFFFTNHIYELDANHPGCDLVQMWREKGDPACMIVELTEAKYGNPVKGETMFGNALGIMSLDMLLRKKRIVDDALTTST